MKELNVQQQKLESMRLMAYKFRLYPTPKQADAIRRNCGCARFVYNWGLEKKIAAHQANKTLSCVALAYELPALKKEFPWLKEDAYSQSLQQSLRHLDNAFSRFFEGISEFPEFKKKGKTKSSFQVPQGFKIDEKNRTIFLPKMGSIQVVLHRPLEGEQKSVTVSMSKAGKFFASVLCEQDVDDPKPQPVDLNTTVGIDMGPKSFLVTSDGRKFDCPKEFRKAESKIGFLDRQMRKKEKSKKNAEGKWEGGKNRNLARLRLAKKYEGVTNRRMDFLHKMSNAIADESQVGTICVEDLNIAGMLKNHKLAKSIQDAGWSTFMQFLEYKCKWRGINLVKIGRFEPSSKMCPCGFKNDDLKCGTLHDRDLLAANNIRTFGLHRAKALDAWAGCRKKIGKKKGRGDDPSKACGAAGDRATRGGYASFRGRLGATKQEASPL